MENKYINNYTLIYTLIPELEDSNFKYEIIINLHLNKEEFIIKLKEVLPKLRSDEYF